MDHDNELVPLAPSMSTIRLVRSKSVRLVSSTLSDSSYAVVHLNRSKSMPRTFSMSVAYRKEKKETEVMAAGSDQSDLILKVDPYKQEE